jgi:hypothetical protein
LASPAKKRDYFEATLRQQIETHPKWQEVMGTLRERAAAETAATPRESQEVPRQEQPLSPLPVPEPQPAADEPAANPQVEELSDSAPVLAPEPTSAPRRKRGPKTKFTTQMLEDAYAAKIDPKNNLVRGRANREAAKILYQCKFPSKAQCRSVASTLKRHSYALKTPAP